MLIFREREAAGRPDGLLILHHGRGTDELDLLPLAGALDPERRLHVVSPRAPLPFPGTSGYRWYEPLRVGHPDPATFHASYQQLAEFHDQVWQQTGLAPSRTVLGGFSMGTAMSYALGLGPDRPAPAGILAFSAFVPTVEGWAPDLVGRTGVRVFIAHGRLDPVIDVSFARRARKLLDDTGFTVSYHESDVGHQIDPRYLQNAIEWLGTVLGRCATP